MEAEKDCCIFWESVQAEIGHVAIHIRNILFLQGLVPNAALGTIAREDIKEIEEDMRNRVALLRKKLANELHKMSDYYGMFGDSPEEFRFSMGETRVIEMIAKTVQEKGLQKLLQRENQGPSTRELSTLTLTQANVNEDVDCANLVKRLRYRFGKNNEINPSSHENKLTGTLLYKLIERFLDVDLAASGNDASLISSVVCQECVIRLNDYDAAHTKALIIQKEFTDLLRKNLEIVVGETKKVKLGNEEMFLKEEVEDSSLVDLTDLEQLSEQVQKEEEEEEEDFKSVFSTDKSVSMKCNTCGDSFRSLNEMRTHSHKATIPEEEEEYDAELEFLDDPVEFNLDDIEYTNEERLEEEERSEAQLEEIAGGEEQKQSEMELEYELIPEEEKPLPRTILCRLAKCTECNVEFSSKAKLKEHIKEQHLVNLNQHVCDICGLMVRSKSALLSHKAKHGRSSKYDCTFCGKSFQQKGALTRHMPMHTGEKPYQCDKCGKQFIHYSSFHMHQLTHGNVRDKKCEICGYMLRSGSHLKRHMRVHSGEKPFECPTCGQKFAQRYNMMTHLKAHQGIYREYSKMYKCHFCDGTFQRKLKLQEHISRVHNTVIDSGLLKPIDRPRKQKKENVHDFDDKQMIKFEQQVDEHFGAADYVSC